MKKAIPLVALLFIALLMVQPGQANAQGANAVQAADIQVGVASSDGVKATGTCGTCEWLIDATGSLTIRPLQGDRGILEEWGEYEKPSWTDYADMIESASFQGVIEARSCYRLFDHCSSLKSVDLSGLDTSGTKSMSRMFEGCSSLTGVDLSELDLSNANSMARMFSGCSSLANLDLSGFDTSSVTDMGSMFGGCSSLTSLDLTSFDTSKVSNMSSMFWGCSSLVSVDLSSFDTSCVTTMEGMFYDCAALAFLDVSRFGTSLVSNMHWL